MGAHKKIVALWLGVLTPLLLFGFSVLKTGHASAAILGSTAIYKKAAVIGEENDCTSRLNALNARGGDPRNIVNLSQPYQPVYWISPQGDATGTVVATTGQTANIPMQINDFEFVCAIVVKNNSNSSRITDRSSIATSANFPDDRDPNPNDGNINAASLWNVNTHINSAAVVSGGGSVVGLNTTGYLSVNRDNTSRYWGSNPIGFQYKPGTALVTDRTVTVRLNVTPINTYNDYPPTGVSQCTGRGGGLISVTSINFGACQSVNVDLTFVVTVHSPNIVITSTPSCTLISGRAVDPDSRDSQLQMRIYEDGAWIATGETSGGGHAFSISMDSIVAGRADRSVDWAAHDFIVYAMGVNSAGAQDGNNGRMEFPIGPCGQPVCGGTTFDTSGGPGSTTNFSVWNRITGASTAPPPPGNTFTNIVIHPPSGPATAPVTRAATALNAGEVHSTPDITYAITQSGTYTVSWTYHGVNFSCSPANVGYHPFISVLGGDVAAGTGFGNGSCGETAADIKTWNTNTDVVPNYFGAGSSIGAWATGHITNFVSGMGLAGNPSAPSYVVAPPGSGHELSFANSNNSEPNAPPNYGGGFGVNDVPCVDDYYGTIDAASPSSTGQWQLDQTNFFSASDNYQATPGGPNTMVQLGTVSHSQIKIDPGKHITLYVKGNVYISSDIIYNPYTLDTVPRFNLYVEGNIFIDPNVTELHGVYIAQEDPASPSNTGRITTCADSPITTVEDYATCSRQLTVVGAMSAENQLRLNRTYGNLSASGPPDNVPAEPAEVFQYSPELWLGASGNADLKANSYTSLPPVL